MRVDKINEIQKRILDVSIALTAEKDYNILLNKIVTEAMSITNADGGTLYILKDNQLFHRVMLTKSLNCYRGVKGEPIDMEPISMKMDNVSSFCALNRKTINIKNVYDSELFDFSGPKKFDQTFGYMTKSMLVCPLINRKLKVVGVLQLINAIDEEGHIISFDPNYELISKSLASQAGILIENMQYIEEIRQLFESFVHVIVKTIDERTPYNRKHSENLSIRIKEFACYLTEIQEGSFIDLTFSEEDIYQLVTAAWLHDIGKIVVPLEILDKPTRLDNRYQLLMNRYDLIKAKIEKNYYKELAENKGIVDKPAQNAFEAQITFVNDLIAFVTETNKPMVIVDESCLEKLNKIYNTAIEGIEEVLLTEEELKHLSIIKGTLTSEERKMIENHVSAGTRILSEMQFPSYLNNVYNWIASHHEYLDGTGYNGYKEPDISLESRMITILDIYDSLVEGNRPYKDAFSEDAAFDILYSMVGEGKLDGDLVKAFHVSRQKEISAH